MKVGEFKLRNGETSKYYFDMKNLVSYPQLLKESATGYIGMLFWNGGCDLLCGTPIGVFQFALYFNYLQYTYDNDTSVCKKI